MKNNRIPLLPALLMMLFATLSAASQSIGQKYDLNFNNVVDCNHSWIYSKYNCLFVKDGKNINQGKTAVELFYKNFKQGKTMRFNLSKTLILPVNIPQEAHIFITSKDDVNHDLIFKVTGLDRNLKELDSGSVKINCSTWNRHSVKLKLTHAKAIRINILYEGDSSENQHVWIDRILIKAGAKDITASNYFSDNPRDSLKTIGSLQKKHLIPLATGNDSTLLLGLKEIGGKKIIGIGECTHGSSTIKKANYQFIKNLILNHHCKLVLLEIPITATLIYNLYIQEKISKDYGRQIEDGLKGSFIDHELLMQFLDWLRAYNMRSDEKVYLFGIDNPDPVAQKLYLFNFYLALLGTEKGGAYYLRNTADEKYADLIKHTKLDTTLQRSLGKQNFECYLAVLNEMILPKNSATFFGDRDINMSKRAISLMNICLKASEQASVLAHSGHLQNFERSKGDTTLGYYLRKYYGDRYFSISFQIGKGTFSQDECSPDVKTITDSLKPPPLYSFEYASLATGIPYFYYPAKYLGNPVLTYCSISRDARYDDLYAFTSPKKQYDAYVFVKESKPMAKIEPSLLIYKMNYFYTKKMAMDSVIKNMGK